jgi:RNA polymerase sigma-70 factor (ECF subfamily)
VRRSSESHFNELYKRYFQRIYNFVHGRVRNHADTEEIVQETFVSVFRSIENYRGQSSLLSWIFGIAKNTTNNSLRRAKNHDTRLSEADPELLRPLPSIESYDPEQSLSMSRYASALRRELDGLAGWQTEIFAMRHLENLSIREISERTDRSSDAIRSSLYRVKRLMLETAEAGGGRATS